MQIEEGNVESLKTNKLLVIIGVSLMISTSLISMFSTSSTKLEAEVIFMSLLFASPFIFSYLLLKFSLFLNKNHGQFFIILNLILFLPNSFLVFASLTAGSGTAAGMGFAFAYLFAGVPQLIVLSLIFSIYLITFIFFNNKDTK